MSGLRKPVKKTTENFPEEKKGEGIASDNSQQSSTKAPQKRLNRTERISQAVSNTHNQWLSSENEEGGPKKEMYSEEEVPLGSILLDKTNHRTRHISVAHPTKNLLPEDHPDYAKNEELISNLIDFSEHLKQEPLRQLPALYRERGKLYTAYGNRRFLALLIAFGPKHVFRFKIYPKKPKDLAKARFQENSQREDVPLSDNILHFQDAQQEAISELESSNEPIKGRVVASAIGIAPSTYSIFSRTLKRDLIMKLIEEGKISEFRVLKELISLKTDDEVLLKLGIKKKTDENQRKKRNGRPKTNVQFPKIKDANVFKDIVNGRLSEFEWRDEDFESFDAMTKKLNECIEKMMAKG